MKNKIIVVTLSMIIAIQSFFVIELLATPYNTMLPSSDGQLEFTNPLYEVGGTVPYTFNNPRDLFVDHEDTLYVSDETKVIKFSNNGQGIEIGEGVLQEAVGIFVTDDLELYVADKKAGAVFVFDETGNYIRQYDRPQEVFFGETTQYNPIDVAVSNTGKIYIASLGTTDGVITLSPEGKFMGFFAANESAKSIYSSEQLTSERLASIFRPAPASVQNITIDEKGLVYTATPGVGNEVRKINFSGINLIADNDTENDEIMDLWIDQYGNIVTINGGKNKEIIVATSDGKMVFTFGNFFAENESTSGLFKSPSAIALNSDQVIFAADSTKKTIQTFVPNETALKLFSGVELYNLGMNEEASNYFLDIMQVSNSFPIAYDNVAMLEYKNKDYGSALDNFKKSGNKEKYSDTYYYVREKWINENAINLLLVIVFLMICKKLFKHFKVNEKLKTKLKIYDKFVNLKNDLLLVLKKPTYTFYLVKYKDFLNVKIATCLYLLAMVIIVGYFTLTDYLFQIFDAQTINVGLLLGLFVAANLIYQISNYLVSRIMYGEGSLRQMYIASSLMYVPLIIIAPFTIVLSYILTYNEGTLYYGLVLLIVGWMATILFNSISEIHNFFPSKTIKNILTTIFTIIVILTVAATFGYLITEIYTLLRSLIVEVIA